MMSPMEATLLIMAAQNVYSERRQIREFEALLAKDERARNIVLAAKSFGIVPGCTLETGPAGEKQRPAGEQQG